MSYKKQNLKAILRSKLLPICKSQPKSGLDVLISSHTGALDTAAVNIQQLEETVKALMRAVTAESAFSQILCLRRGHPFLHQIHVKRCFSDFWEVIQPSASKLVYWSKAQKKKQTFEPISPSPTCRLQLVEFFLFCCRVAAGLQEKVLADMFQVSVSTVSHVVIPWANYRYLLLGSLPCSLAPSPSG